MLSGLFLVVGPVFSALAALIAFFVTYNEYRHRFTGWRLWKECLTVGGFTLVLFLVVTWLLTSVLPSLV